MSDFWTASLAAHSATLPSAAVSAIIRKKFAFAMLLQKPPRNPARTSAGKVVANQTPIMMEVVPAGGGLGNKARPAGAGGSSPVVAREKEPTDQAWLAVAAGAPSPPP